MKKLFKQLTFARCFVVTWEFGGRSVPKSALAAWWASVYNTIEKITYEP